LAEFMRRTAKYFSMITAQHHTEASANPAMTRNTGQLAWAIK
jgi:hypothetical protein